MRSLSNWAKPRFHYAWIVLGITFLVMLITAGTRAAPSVMMIPLEQTFGWSRTTISTALAINLALFGLIGPFSAAAMQHFGIRKTVIFALMLLAISVGVSSLMNAAWQMWLIWGFIVGCATGVTSTTLGATIVSQWFSQRRGFAMGLLTASSATGQLIFLPLLASIVTHYGWRPVVLTIAIGAAILLPLVYFFLPEKPLSLDLPLYGDEELKKDDGKPKLNPIQNALATLKMASHSKDFWLLFFSFFVCGATTNGYIGTHFIAMCGDYGFSEVKAASILAAMGALDLIGTTLSGWLSDRWNNRVLLFWYYGLRGLALIFLPTAFGIEYFGLPIFAFFYGLDWVATVPPTVRLTTDVFGKEKAPVVFGWIVAGHQLGAAFSALMGGVLRNSLGTYTLATMLAGSLGLVAALAVLQINKQKQVAA